MKSERLIKVHLPLMSEPQRSKSILARQIRFKNRRVVLRVHQDDYVLMFKTLLDGKIVKTTVPLSREALAGLVALYDGCVSDERRQADIELLKTEMLPPRRKVVMASVTASDDAE